MAYSAKSQKIYNDKCEVIRVKYSEKDKQEYIRMINYITDIGITKTEYIKGLIKADLDSKSIAYPAPSTDTEDR